TVATTTIIDRTRGNRMARASRARVSASTIITLISSGAPNQLRLSALDDLPHLAALRVQDVSAVPGLVATAVIADGPCRVRPSSKLVALRHRRRLLSLGHCARGIGVAGEHEGGNHAQQQPRQEADGELVLRHCRSLRGFDLWITACASLPGRSPGRKVST